MAKYQPLTEFLEHQSRKRVTLTFEEIEQIIGQPLAGSALKYPAWWANEFNPDTSHTQARAWLGAGYSVSVNLIRQTARFEPKVSRRRAA